MDKLQLDSGRMVCKTYIFISSNLLSSEPENRIKNLLKSLTQPLYYCFE